MVEANEDSAMTLPAHEILVQTHDVFYEVQRQATRESREQTELVFLKCFNNFVKSVLINEYTRGLKKLSVLDLACGKGGDIPHKWSKVDVAHYVGADLSRESIKSAKEKYESCIGSLFPAIFIVQDASDDNEGNMIDSILRKEPGLRSIKQPIMFDIVSTQFAIHYMFETQAKLRAFLRNVTDRLEEHGTFIGTTVDADRVVCRVREAGPDMNLTIGNDFYSIIFGQDTFKKKDGAFGIKYYFYLLDSVGKLGLSDGRPTYVPEYLVPFDALIEIALEYGLVLEKKLNFHEYYEQKRESSHFLFQKMVMNNGSVRKLSQD